MGVERGSGRLRLLATNYDVHGQSVRGFVVDAQAVCQAGLMDLNGSGGLTFADAVRVRDLLECAVEKMDEGKPPIRG